MKNLIPKTIVAMVLLAASFLLYGADVTIAPPVGGGFVVRDAAGTQDRMRVQETGAVSIPQLTNAASADTTLCFDAATGRLGPCSASSITRTVQGTIQKGPYIFGSSVWISELDKNLNQNGKSYIVQTNSDFGNFDGPTITVNNVEMLGDGYYMDELSGGLSLGRLMLRAIVDLSVDPNPIINILTTIQTPRLKYLLKSGMAYAAAYSQSQREVITAFGINPDSIVNLGNLSQMNISGSRDQDAVLLSASVVLLKMAANSVVANPSSSSTAELSRLVSVIARDLEKDGVLNDATIISARRTANTQINLPQVRTNVESYYASIGQTVTAPKFEEWVDVDGSGVLPRRVLPFPGLVFADLTGVEPNQTFTSNAVTLSGFGSGVGAAVTVTAGTIIVKNGSAASGTTLTAVDGDTIALRVTSLGYGLTKSAPITVGSSSATWHVTTKSLGGTISGLTSSGLVLQNNGGDNITIVAGSTSFTFPATVANGASYYVSVLTHPTTPLQICTVSDGTGTVGAAVSNISVVCSTSSYVTYASGDTDIAYGINPTTGKLTQFGIFDNRLNASTYRASITADPSGKFAFVAYSLVSGHVQTYAINASTGEMTSVGTIAAGSYPSSIAVDPTGRFAYVANNGSDNVSAYTINTTTGALTAVAGSPFASGGQPNGIAIDPTGKFAYVANGGSVSAYTIDATTGALTAVTGSPFATGTGSQSLTVDPTGKFVYVQGGSDNVAAYTIHATTGALTAVTGSPFATGTQPRGVTVDPTGKFAYVANQISDNISIYSINSTTGGLTSAGIVSAPPYPRSIYVDPTGKFAYVITAWGISAYSINSTTGLLTLINSIGGQGANSMTIVKIR